MNTTREEIQNLLSQAIAELNSGRYESAEASLDKLLMQELDVLTAGELIERASALKRNIRQQRNLLWNARLISITVIINAILIGYLIAIPVSKVAIDGTIGTGKVILEVDHDVEFTPPKANSATLSSFDSIEIDASILSSKCEADADCQGQPVLSLLKPTDGDSNLTIEGDSISIEYLKLFPGTAAELILTEEKGKGFAVKVLDGRYEGEINITGRFRLDCDGMDRTHAVCNKDVVLEQTGGIVLTGEKSARINLYVTEVRGDRKLSENFYISNIALETKEPRGKVTSHLMQGVIRLLSFASDPVKLQEGDFLHIVPDESFKVIKVSVGDTINLRINGDARILTLNGRQLKPSLLKWLQEHSKISLFIGVLLSLTAFVLPILQRTNLLRDN